ncbi:hypothetical protein D3C80_1740530 [compost metagenome]
MQIAGDPLALLHDIEFRNPFIGILQLSLQLILVITVISRNRKQHHGDDTHQHKRQL